MMVAGADLRPLAIGEATFRDILVGLTAMEAPADVLLVSGGHGSCE